MSAPGLVSPEAFGASIASFIPNTSALPRKIGTFSADVTIEEEQTDELTITRHPVEQGANITDHAYKEPSRVVIRCGFSNSSRSAGGNPQYVQDVYNGLLALQISRVPFNIITGKRKYSNMLLKAIAIDTDSTSENALMMTASCEEVILVATQVTNVPPQANQQIPQKTAPIQSQGTVQLAPKSIAAVP